MTDWTIEQARETYSIDHWSDGYFGISDQGNVIARPVRQEGKESIDLYQLRQDIRAHNMTLPVLVRFTDILHDRVASLCDSFDQSMQQHGYQGGYTPVYPIKVNQQASVVQQIIAGGKGRTGLEAGSKPELMAVIGMAQTDGGMIVCNGYKDREYIRLALIAQKLGHRVFIVIEKLSELGVIIEEANRLAIKPTLGVRVRLASIGVGKWQNTGGEKSKFGLSASQILRVISLLEENGILDCLQMLHFHPGSQLANIRDIQRGMQECARYFSELHRLGVNLQYVDVGGGLGVDYEGTGSRSTCSMNYSMQAYANNIVHTLREVCEANGIKHPHIMSESGRAMTAHHAVLITNVIDSEQVSGLDNFAAPADDDALLLHDLWQAWQMIGNESSARIAIEIYHDAQHWLAEAHSMYSHGMLGLQQRAGAEELYFAICRKVRPLLSPANRLHREVLDELNEKLADKYFCNFSLFQSIPDVWAIEQIFPVLPLHRLGERPLRRAVVEDITCDSDGRIDYYVDNEGIETSLPVHELRDDEEYLLGIFMVGAYQEILGDMHNLFGDTDSVHVESDTDGKYHLSKTLHGDTVDSVLRYVHINANDLLKSYKQKIEQADLPAENAVMYLTELEEGLSGYTYLED